MQLICFKLKLDWMLDICKKLSCDTFLKQLSWRGTKRVSSRKSLILSQQSYFLNLFIYLCGKQKNPCCWVNRPSDGEFFMPNVFLFLCIIFIISVLQESVSVMVSRQAITDLVSALPKIEHVASKEVSIFLLEGLQSRAISYEEQVPNLDFL